MSESQIIFITVDDVLEFHELQIAEFGGDPAVRDIGLLESAVAMPAATFGGEYLHRDIYEMAATYLVHLVKNHPFVDGNKRSGTVAALAFLRVNGVEAHFPDEPLYNLVLAVATGQAGKDQAANFFRQVAEAR